MELEQSRLPVDGGAIEAALAAAGWTGPAPLLLGGGAEPPGAIDTAPDLQALIGADVGGWLRIAVVVHGSAAGAPGWLPLLGALAAADAVRAAASLPVEIEWPAVLAVPGGMCGGAAGSRSVGEVRAVPASPESWLLRLALRVGVGALDLEQGTTSLFASGGGTDRAALAAAWMVQLSERLAQWRSGDDGLTLDYRARCATIGRRTGEGSAWVSGIDSAGDLVVTA